MMLSMTCLLLKFQIRNYWNEISIRVIKLKHSVIILLVLTIPSIAVLNTLMVSPLSAVLKPEQDSSFGLISIFLLESAYIFLIAWQRNAFTANQEQHHHSLPIKKSVWRLSIVIRLLIANNIFLLPIILLPWIIEFPLTLYGKFIFVIRYLLLITYIFIGQLAFLKKKYYLFVLVFLGDLLIALNGKMNFSFHVSYADILLIITTLLPFLLLLPSKNLNAFSDWKVKEYISLAFRRLYNFNINYLILFRKYKAEMAIRLFLAIFITYCCSMLSSHSSIAPQFLATLLSSSLSLLMSGLFLLLKNSREEAISYLNALPISRINWFIKDYCAITSVVVIFVAGFLLANNLLTVMTTRASLILTVSIFLFPVLLGFFQHKVSRFATLLSSTVVFIWSITIGLNLDVL